MSHQRKISIEPGTDSAIIAIVESVASITGEEPTELPLLDQQIDIDLVKRFFVSSMGGELEGGYLTFEYEGVTVTLTHSGELLLEWE